MKLILNADDFGYSRGHNYGILDCMLEGSVTSTTLLTTMTGTEHAFQIIKKHNLLDVGIHLSLDIGKPVLAKEKIPSLIDKSGFFNVYDLSENKLGINPEEAYIEWKAQIEYAMANGVRPTHFDSHHHVHMKEDVFDVYVKLAREYNVAIRFHPQGFSEEKKTSYQEKIKDISHTDYFTSAFYKEGVNYEFFKKLAQEEYEIVEVMCHPAYLDDVILSNSSYTHERTLEQKILTSKKLDQLLEELGIELISYRPLVK